MSFNKFYKFYNVLYVSRTESAPWATTGQIPWPAGASLAQTRASVSEITETDMQCRSFSASQSLSGSDVSARLPSSEAQRRPREAQRGPERPRESQRGPGKPREAQRGPERARRSPEKLTEAECPPAQRGSERPNDDYTAVEISVAALPISAGDRGLTCRGERL